MNWRRIFLLFCTPSQNRNLNENRFQNIPINTETTASKIQSFIPWRRIWRFTKCIIRFTFWKISGTIYWVWSILYILFQIPSSLSFSQVKCLENYCMVFTTNIKSYKKIFERRRNRLMNIYTQAITNKVWN